jgi:hypothetical protein
MVEVYSVLPPAPIRADFTWWHNQGKIPFHFTEMTS